MILDTNAFSALAEGDERLGAILEDSRILFLPVIALGEYRYGILKSRRREEYESWLQRDLPLFRLLPITAETTPHYAALRLGLKQLGRPIPANDAWIGALALQHHLPVVSRDRHFDAIAGVTRLAW